jgi:glycosyltransferase involved in cell wall biosynthesis
MLSRAVRIVIPSRYLAAIARGWGVPAERVIVVPNPAPTVGEIPRRDELRRRLGINGTTFVFAGRLVAAKDLPLAVAAMRHVPEARLVIVGDGPERRRVADAIADAGVADRVVLTGGLRRPEAIQWLRAADAAVLSSAWENLPHAAVEAIAVGTPVVATAVGGVPEVVETGVNGILVSPGDEHALAGAMRSIVTDAELSARLREGALESAARYEPDRAYEAIERELVQAVSRRP